MRFLRILFLVLLLQTAAPQAMAAVCPPALPLETACHVNQAQALWNPYSTGQVHVAGQGEEQPPQAVEGPAPCTWACGLGPCPRAWPGCTGLANWYDCQDGECSPSQIMANGQPFAPAALTVAVR